MCGFGGVHEENKEFLLEEKQQVSVSFGRLVNNFKPTSDFDGLSG